MPRFRLESRPGLFHLTLTSRKGPARAFDPCQMQRLGRLMQVKVAAT